MMIYSMAMKSSDLCYDEEDEEDCDEGLFGGLEELEAEECMAADLNMCMAASAAPVQMKMQNE